MSTDVSSCFCIERAAISFVDIRDRVRMNNECLQGVCAGPGVDAN